MRSMGGSFGRAAGALALALMLAQSPLGAQSVNDYRLPGATVRPADPGAQGPVDRDVPRVTVPIDRPNATPSASPAPTQAPPRSTAVATPRPAASGSPRPITAPVRAATVGSAPTTAAQTPLSAPTAVSSDVALPEPSVAPPPTSAVPTPGFTVAEPAAPGLFWPWIVAAIALLAAIIALLWWHRRRETADMVVEFERPVVAPAAAPPVKAAPEAVPALAVAARTPAEPPMLFTLPPGLGMTLEARRMSASLMATTLSYVVTLTNSGTERLSALAVEGDMISAHASLPPEQQIAQDSQRLELRHALVELAPGESAEFSGDFRLPLTAVTPIRAGEVAFFVPLARLRVEASTPAGQALIQAQTYVVGELPEAEGGALRPFRLDLGPRTYSRIGQRAVN